MKFLVLLLALISFNVKADTMSNSESKVTETTTGSLNDVAANLTQNILAAENPEEVSTIISKQFPVGMDKQKVIRILKANHFDIYREDDSEEKIKILFAKLGVKYDSLAHPEVLYAKQTIVSVKREVMINIAIANSSVQMAGGAVLYNGP